MVYISITGLEIKAVYHVPKFWYYAIPAMIQARSAPGNISAENRQLNGVHHTLSIWEDRRSMLRYIHRGDHLKAMRIMDDIAIGKTYGYEADVVPTWDEVVDIYENKAKEYISRKRAKAHKAHGASSTPSTSPDSDSIHSVNSAVTN